MKWDAWASKVECVHPEEYDCSADNHRRWTLAERDSGLALYADAATGQSSEVHRELMLSVLKTLQDQMEGA